jgi:hypothetical protein
VYGAGHRLLVQSNGLCMSIKAIKLTHKYYSQM